MFAKPVAVDVEAQPLKQQQRGLMAPVSLRTLMDKNQRPMMRWRRLRPLVIKEAGRVVLRKANFYHQSSMAEKMPAMKMSLSNPMRFLQEDCPEDVLPLILAFAGPQSAAVLYRTNRHWKNVMDEEATWKVLCQELYKVRA